MVAARGGGKERDPVARPAVPGLWDISRQRDWMNSPHLHCVDCGRDGSAAADSPLSQGPTRPAGLIEDRKRKCSIEAAPGFEGEKVKNLKTKWLRGNTVIEEK